MILAIIEEKVAVPKKKLKKNKGIEPAFFDLSKNNS